MKDLNNSLNMTLITNSSQLFTYEFNNIQVEIHQIKDIAINIFQYYLK